MYDLNLTPEQLEFRDTVRQFVTETVRPVIYHPDRLQDPARPLPIELIDEAAQMGLRALELAEEAGGAGADMLTAALVMEELGAGDADIAVTLGCTSAVAHLAFDRLMSTAQRDRFLPQFLADERCHLAFAPRLPDPDSGWRYCRPLTDEAPAGVTAAPLGNGDWLLNGSAGYVLNAPIAKLIVVQAAVSAAPQGRSAVVTLLVPADAAGLDVREPEPAATDIADGMAPIRWHHGTGGELVFRECRVPAANVLAGAAAVPSLTDWLARGSVLSQAVNLGVARATLEAGVEYAKLRVQGARPIVQHQAIGNILANAAVKVEAARALIRQAAYALDHPEAQTGRSLSALPLHDIAKVYSAEALFEAVEGATECFGAMGVMLDMPLPKYMRDARIFMHAFDSNNVARLRIAEALAGFERGQAAADAVRSAA